MPGPDLDLNVQQPNNSGLFGGNPLGAISDLSRIQLMNNQNRLFQQEFQAKQIAGQIIATSPDDATAVQRMKADPRVGPWATQIESTMLGNSATLANIALEKQHTQQSAAETTLAGTRNVEAATGAGRNIAETGQIGAQTAAKWAETGQSAYSSVLNGLAPTLTDPGSFEKWYTAATSAIPDSVLDANSGTVRKSLTNIHDILGPLAATDPDGYKRQVGAALLRTGMSPEATAQAAGTIPRQIAPGTGSGVGLIGGVGQPPGMGGIANPVTGGPSGAPAGNPIAPSPGAGTPPTAPGAPQAAAAAAPLHPDGTALAAPDSMIPKPVVSSINGMPMRDPSLTKSIGDQLDKWNAEQPNYDAAAQTSAKLTEQKQNLETMAEGGSWLQPGPGAQFRLGLGNLVNLANSVAHPGEPPLVDVTKLAAGQNSIKDTANLGFGVAKANFGGGREALGVLENAISSVPGIDNTALGGMLVSDVLKASTDWKAAQQPFKQDWLQRTGGPGFAGDLTGSDSAYLKLHPPSAVIQPVLDKYGLGSDGFKSEADLAKMFNEGLINSKIFYTEAAKKGWVGESVYKKAKDAGFPNKIAPGDQ